MLPVRRNNSTARKYVACFSLAKSLGKGAVGKGKEEEGMKEKDEGKDLGEGESQGKGGRRKGGGEGRQVYTLSTYLGNHYISMHYSLPYLVFLRCYISNQIKSNQIRLLDDSKTAIHNTKFVFVLGCANSSTKLFLMTSDIISYWFRSGFKKPGFF